MELRSHNHERPLLLKLWNAHGEINQTMKPIRP